MRILIRNHLELLNKERRFLQNGRSCRIYSIDGTALIDVLWERIVPKDTRGSSSKDYEKVAETHVIETYMAPMHCSIPWPFRRKV